MIHTNVFIYISLYIYTYIYTHTHSMYVYRYIYIYLYIYLYPYIPIYLCVCVYIYMCRYILYIHVYILVHVECLHTRPSIYPSFFIPTWNFSFPNSQGAYYFIFYVSFCLCALLPFVSFVLSFQQAGACSPVQI